MFDPQNESMRHLMMFETFRNQQESMRHLNRIMAEDHRRMVKPPHQSVYRMSAGSRAVTRCPVCRAELEQYPDMGMSACGFCGAIVSYEDRKPEIRDYSIQNKKLRKSRRLTDKSRITILFVLLVIAGLVLIFAPIENIRLSDNAGQGINILVYILLGGILVIALYAVFRIALWIWKKAKEIGHEKRSRRYTF